MVFAEASEGQRADPTDYRSRAGCQSSTHFAHRIGYCFRNGNVPFQLFAIAGDQKQTVIDSCAIAENRDVDAQSFGDFEILMVCQDRQQFD